VTNRVIALIVIWLLGTFAWMPSTSADGMYRGHRPHFSRHFHHRRLAWDEAAVSYQECYTGWWQTLSFGHVRPRWGTYCRR
jgi:hypothetical protein